MDEVAERVRADIEQHGWHVALIPGDERAPSWVHTIGLHERFEHPEIVVFGLELETGHRLANQIGLQIKQGTRYRAGERYAGILEGHDCGFREIAERWHATFLGNVAWYYERSDVPALQIYWPDRTGHLPWDPEFDPSWTARQPLLFEASVERALSPEFAAVLREDGALE